jgi:phosphatidylglycerophosphate synthase
MADKVLHIYVLYQFQTLYPQLAIPFVLVVIFAVVLASLPGIVVLFKVVRRLGANWFGKAKLCVEGAAIIMLFLRNPNVAYALLWLAIALAIASIIGHLAIKQGHDYRWWWRWILRIKARND